jgi:hypothetical protein
MISWLRRKHTSMALSIEEEEYITTSVEIPEAMWLHKFPAGIFDLEFEPT